MFLKVAIPLYPLIVERCSFIYRTLTPTRDCMYPGSAAEIMGKFVHDLNLSVDYTWFVGTEVDSTYTDFGRRLPNGSYTGVLGKVLANVYDMLVSDVLITSERLFDFNLSYPISYPDSYFYYNKIYNTDATSSVYDVFPLPIWIGILSCLFLLSICFSVTYGVLHDKSIGQNVCSAVWTVLSLLAAQAQAIHSRYSNVSVRSLLATYAILLIIFLPLYQSKLLMRLLITSERATFQGTTSLASLVEAKQRLMVLVEEYGYEQMLYSNQQLEPCQKMRAALRKNPPLRISSIEDIGTALKQHPTAVIGLFEKRLILLGLGYLCNLPAGMQLDNDIKLPAKTFLFRKGHIAVKSFNQWVSTNSEFVQYINEKYDFLAERKMRQKQANCSSFLKTTRTLSPGRLLGAWLFLLIGLILATSVVLVEIIMRLFR